MATPGDSAERHRGRSLQRRRVAATPRGGLTLYEVILALAIFAGAAAALSQLIATGSRAAIQSRLQTQAILHCESKLAEVVAGAEPLAPVSGLPVSPDFPDWTWSLEVAPGPHADLLDLRVSVAHVGQNGSPDATWSLRRFVRDPQLYEEAALAEAAEAEGL